jgi:hypothetical protein
MSQKLVHRHGDSDSDWRENLKESEPEGTGTNPASATGRARATSVTAALDTSSLVDTKSGQDSESIIQPPLEQSTSDKETNTASGNFNLKLQLRRRYSLRAGTVTGPGTQSASGVRPVLSVRVPVLLGLLVVALFSGGDHWHQPATTFPCTAGIPCQWCPFGFKFGVNAAAPSPGERQGLVNLYTAVTGSGILPSEPCSISGVRCNRAGTSILYVMVQVARVRHVVCQCSVGCFLFTRTLAEV